MSTALDPNMFREVDGEIAWGAERTMICERFEGQPCSVPECEISGPHSTINDMMLQHNPRAGPQARKRSGNHHVMSPRSRASSLIHSLDHEVYKLPAPLVLQDVQVQARARPESFQAPSLDTAKRISLGDLAQISFKGHPSIGPGEWVWVEVVKTITETDPKYVGVITHPVMMLRTPNKHLLIAFQAKHVGDIIPREDVADLPLE